MNGAETLDPQAEDKDKAIVEYSNKHSERSKDLTRRNRAALMKHYIRPNIKKQEQGIKVSQEELKVLNRKLTQYHSEEKQSKIESIKDQVAIAQKNLMCLQDTHLLALKKYLTTLNTVNEEDLDDPILDDGDKNFVCSTLSVQEMKITTRVIEYLRGNVTGAALSNKERNAFISRYELIDSEFSKGLTQAERITRIKGLTDASTQSYQQDKERLQKELAELSAKLSADSTQMSPEDKRLCTREIRSIDAKLELIPDNLLWIQEERELALKKVGNEHQQIRTRKVNNYLAAFKPLYETLQEINPTYNKEESLPGATRLLESRRREEFFLKKTKEKVILLKIVGRALKLEKEFRDLDNKMQEKYTEDYNEMCTTIIEKYKKLRFTVENYTQLMQQLGYNVPVYVQGHSCQPLEVTAANYKPLEQSSSDCTIYVNSSFGPD